MDNETTNNSKTKKKHLTYQGGGDGNVYRQSIPADVNDVDGDVEVNVDNDEDEDIRRALALSLMEVESEPNDIPSFILNEKNSISQQQQHQKQKQQQQQTQFFSHGNSVSSTSETIPETALVQSNIDTLTSNCSIEVSSYTSHSIIEFHTIMWDSTLTTDSDQQRWLQQGIDVQQTDSIPTDSNANLIPDPNPSLQLQQQQLQQKNEYENDSDIDANTTNASICKNNENSTMNDTDEILTVEGTLLKPVADADSDDVNYTRSDTGTGTTQQTNRNTGTTGSSIVLPPAAGSEQNDMILLEELAASHLPWGLVQDHGGPCGVLAAIQAELLRILLFSTVSSSTTTGSTTSSASANVTSSQSIQTALAGAIAYILARAALTPSAVSSNELSSVSIDERKDVQENVPTPATGTSTTPQESSSIEGVHNDITSNTLTTLKHNNTSIQQPTGTVNIILPNHPINAITNNALDWDDLQPWSTGASTTDNHNNNASGLSNLLMFSIRLKPSTVSSSCNNHDDDDDDINNDGGGDNDIDDSSSTAKRQKVTSRNRTQQQQEQLQSHSIESSHSKDCISDLNLQETMTHDDEDIDDHNDCTSPIQIQIQTLANNVQQFLLSPLHTYYDACSGATEQIRPLEYFRHNGGVLLLVMSIAATRGISVLREEFDDITGCRLTSNFGHCSQELINIFLTGQAVSNVFDNTLTPVGMVCRGIQSRPMIGYLTQLEAMRYCEVGSYYKSPKVPIWVVGSTSHFTVLFGHRIALKESQSDILLDQCRRAFKRVDVEENGFIGTNQLSDVFQNLESTITRKKRKNKENIVDNDINNGNNSNNDSLYEIDIDPVKIQALSAALEVTGADIILWDDFWKATSRLLMGASFESVILKINSDTNDDLTENDDPICLGSRNMTLSTTANTIDYDSSTKRNTSETNSIGNNHEEYNNDDDIAHMPPLLLRNDANSIIVEDSMAGETDEQMARRLQREWEQESSTTATTITTVTTSASTATNTAAAAAAAASGGGKEAVARVGSPMDIDSPHQYKHYDTATASFAAATNAPTSNFAVAASSGLVLSDEEFARLLQAEWDAEAASGIEDGEAGTVSTPISGFGGGGGGDASSVVALSGSPSQDQAGAGAYYNQNPVTPPRTIGVNPMNMSTVAEEEGMFDMDHEMMDSLKPAARQSTINSAETEKMKSTLNPNLSSSNDDTTGHISSSDHKENTVAGSTNGRGRIDFEKYGDSFKLYHYNGLRGGVLTPFQVTRLTADEAVGSSIALRRSGTGGGSATVPSSTTIVNDIGGSSNNNIINIAQDLEDVVRTKWPSCVLQWPKFSDLASID